MTEIADATVATQNIVVNGEYLVDADTGECLGLVNKKERWSPSTDEDIHYILGLFQEAAAEKVKQQALRAAALDHYDAKINAQDRRTAYLEMRFKADLEALAEKRLAGSKDKTFGTPYGNLAFRTIPEHHAVIYEPLAIAWAEKNHPDAVEKHLKISMLKGIDLPRDAFEIVPERQSFSINTGIKPFKREKKATPATPE